MSSAQQRKYPLDSVRFLETLDCAALHFVEVQNLRKYIGAINFDNCFREDHREQAKRKVKHTKKDKVETTHQTMENSNTIPLSIEVLFSAHQFLGNVPSLQLLFTYLILLFSVKVQRAGVSPGKENCSISCWTPSWIDWILRFLRNSETKLTYI